MDAFASLLNKNLLTYKEQPKLGPQNRFLKPTQKRDCLLAPFNSTTDQLFRVLIFIRGNAQGHNRYCSSWGLPELQQTSPQSQGKLKLEERSSSVTASYKQEPCFTRKCLRFLSWFSLCVAFQHKASKHFILPWPNVTHSPHYNHKGNHKPELWETGFFQIPQRELEPATPISQETSLWLFRVSSLILLPPSS